MRSLLGDEGSLGQPIPIQCRSVLIGVKRQNQRPCHQWQNHSGTGTRLQLGLGADAHAPVVLRPCFWPSVC